MMKTNFLCGFLLLMSFQLKPHGDLHERINLISEIISAHPDSAELYLKRGELRFLHEEYNQALGDLQIAAALELNSIGLDYNFARVLASLKDFPQSLHHLNKILAREDGHILAHRLKGKVLFEIEKFAEAASSFENVISLANKVLPSNFLDASHSYELSGSEMSYALAEEVILRGVERLGPLSTFYLRLVDLALVNRDFPKAIQYQTIIIGQSNRKEKALYQRAQIHLKRGDKAKALADFAEAHRHYENLPQRIKTHQSMKELQANIDHHLNQIN